MSLHDYLESRKLVAQDPPFYALIMAAMQKADSENKIRLQTVFPFVWAELKKRYEAPGGKIDGERLTSVDEPLVCEHGLKIHEFCEICDVEESRDEPSEAELTRGLGDVKPRPFDMFDKDHPERYHG